jgi:hypothetical protein
MFNNISKQFLLILSASLLAMGCVHEMGPFDAASEEPLLQFEDLDGPEAKELIKAGDGTTTTLVSTAPVNAPQAHASSMAAAFQGTGGTAQGSIDIKLSNSTLHVDQPTAKVGVRVLDEQGNDVGKDVLVKTTFSAPFLPSGSQSFACITDDFGTCTFAWTAPDAAFVDGGDVQVAISSAQLNASTILVVFAAPNALFIEKPGAGVQLPTAPYKEGQTFQVPLYIETSGTTPGAYDIEFNFDPKKLRILGATAGECVGFAAPITNAAFNANKIGQLNVIGLGSTGYYDCITEERIHVANLTFEVLPGAAEGQNIATSPITCLVKDLIDDNLTALAHDKPCDFGDAMGTGKSGEVLIEPAQ